MKSDPQGQQDVVIIGGGIVGVATAALLAEAGRQVLVLDRTGICEETSAGNAAALAFSDILPMASKGIMRKVPGWLMDPLGPLAIRPSYLPKLLPGSIVSGAPAVPERWKNPRWRRQTSCALRNARCWR